MQQTGLSFKTKSHPDFCLGVSAYMDMGFCGSNHTSWKIQLVTGVYLKSSLLTMNYQKPATSHGYQLASSWEKGRSQTCKAYDLTN